MGILLGHLKRVARLQDKRAMPSVFLDESRYGLAMLGDKFEPACAPIQIYHPDLEISTSGSKLLLPHFQLKGHGRQQCPSRLVRGPPQQAQKLIALIGTVFDSLHRVLQFGRRIVLQGRHLLTFQKPSGDFLGIARKSAAVIHGL
jgi:hypothetical protein